MNEVSKSLINKISALLAKTVEHGASEAEASTAADMVRRLLDKHNLTMKDLPKDSGGVHEFSHPDDLTRGTWVGRVFQPWQVHIAVGVAKLYDCQVLHSRARPVWLGEETDTTICAEIFDFVLAQVYHMKDAALARAKTEDPYLRGQSFANSYLKGISHRLYEILNRMAEQRKSNLRQSADSDSHALMVISFAKEQAVNAWVKQNTIGRHYTREAPIRSGEAYDTGQRDAANVRVSRELRGDRTEA